ncbi:MAG: hypothetical protein KGJ64_07670 [Betaproteobacteria bacterium]|nr:hypothetical protein [Betaproteobacteria bacterium]
MRCSNTAWTRVLPGLCGAWKRVLPGLFGASVACAAWADAGPSRLPIPDVASEQPREQTGGEPREDRSAAAGGESDPIEKACQDEQVSIWQQIRRHGAVIAMDEQAPDLRQYWVRAVYPEARSAEHGRCEADCVAVYIDSPPGTRPTYGVCRWLPGAWAGTLQYEGGCGFDRLDMHWQIAQHGSISVRDARNPGGEPLHVTTIDETDATTADHTCTAACSGPAMQPSVCRWKLFDWGASITASPNPAVACLSDYDEMRQQILEHGSISVPDAEHPQTLRHMVNELPGQPSPRALPCSVRCSDQPGAPGTCTWAPSQWGDTIRYHRLQRDGAARY